MTTVNKHWGIRLLFRGAGTIYILSSTEPVIRRDENGKRTGLDFTPVETGGDVIQAQDIDWSATELIISWRPPTPAKEFRAPKAPRPKTASKSRFKGELRAKKGQSRPGPKPGAIDYNLQARLLQAIQGNAVSESLLAKSGNARLQDIRVNVTALIERGILSAVGPAVAGIRTVRLAAGTRS